MKKFIVGIIILLSSVSCEAQTPEQLSLENQNIDTTQVIVPGFEHSKVNTVITTLLERAHYKKAKLTDSLSAVIWENYIQSLDNNKIYFLQTDIDDFEKFKFEIDDNLEKGKLDAGYDIFNRFKVRVNDRMIKILKRVEEGFDFTIDEVFTPNREDAEWSNSNEELDGIWRKRLKNDALNLKINGKEWDDIVETLTNRYKNYHRAILQYKAEDVFQLYMNAYADALDPHSNYFSPLTSDNFRISMSLTYSGIGAELSTRNDYTVIARIIPGGPAFTTALLKEEDKIVGVAQGEDGKMIDIIGWRLTDVIQLIRGEEGSLVRLQIIPAGQAAELPPTEIRLTREKVKLEGQSAKKEIISLKQDETTFKIGIIDVPSFYYDFEAQQRGETDFKSTTKDVKKLLGELKEEGVDGVIVDLRNNGGGALNEAIDLTGLFIKDGPIVQVRNSNGIVEVGRDKDPELVYDGPMAVLVNRFSASASEIFSGAIQDYGRGLVIGEQTYGKGTVQNLFNVDRYIPTIRKKLGQVKLTIAKYYRITGSSTQHMGVIPDIEFPPSVSHEDFGESSKPSALPWDQIRSARFEKYGDLSPWIPQLLERYEARAEKDQEFQNLIDDYKEMDVRRHKKTFSLNEVVRQQERDGLEAKRKKREEEKQVNADIEVLQKDEVTTPNDPIDDPILEEGARILADLIIFSAG